MSSFNELESNDGGTQQSEPINAAYWKALCDDKDARIAELVEKIGSIHNDYLTEREKIVTNYESKLEYLEKESFKRNEEINYLTEKLTFVSNIKFQTDALKREIGEAKMTKNAMRNASALDKQISTSNDKDGDKTMKTVLLDNMRLMKTLNYHTEENCRLKKMNERLKEDNEYLKSEKETAEMLTYQKVAASRKQKQLILELREKLSTQEFLLQNAESKLNSNEKALVLVQNDITKNTENRLMELEKSLEMKSKELRRMKQLNKGREKNKSRIESFFIEALNDVKKEIENERNLKRKEAEREYNVKMLDAALNKKPYPRICTFNRRSRSTNNIFSKLENETKFVLQDDVDISTLTWSEKERVLKYLFKKLRTKKNTEDDNLLNENFHPTFPMDELQPLQITEKEAIHDKLPDITKSVFVTETEC